MSAPTLPPTGGAESQIADIAHTALTRLYGRKGMLITELRRIDTQIAKLESAKAVVGVETLPVPAEAHEDGEELRAEPPGLEKGGEV